MSADEYGYKRGCGAYSATSIKLARPNMVHPVHSVEGKMSNGPVGALPVGGKARYKPNSGPITNGGGTEVA